MANCGLVHGGLRGFVFSGDEGELALDGRTRSFLSLYVVVCWKVTRWRAVVKTDCFHIFLFTICACVVDTKGTNQSDAEETPQSKLQPRLLPSQFAEHTLTFARPSTTPA